MRGAIAADFNNNQTLCQVVIADADGTFLQHMFETTVTVSDITEETRTVNWELKNLTKTIVIADGSWSYIGVSNQTMKKILTETTNYIGDTIQLKVWLSESKIANVLGISLNIHTPFT